MLLIKISYDALSMTSISSFLPAASKNHIEHSMTCGISKIKSPLSFFNSKGMRINIKPSRS